MNLKQIIYSLFILVIVTSTGIAQYGSLGSADARSIGMGKTYTANAFGVFSLGFNPANMITEDNNTIQLSTALPLPTVSAYGGVNVLSLDDINYFFGGIDGESRVLTESDKQRLIQQFEDGGFVSTNGSVQFLSFQVTPSEEIGAFGISVSDFVGAKGRVPAALVDLTLNGNPVDKIFDMSDGEFSAWWIRNYSISYARNIYKRNVGFIKTISAGVTAKLVHGFAYAGSEEVGTYFTTSEQNEISGQSNFLAYSSFSDNFGVKYEFDSLSHSSSFELFPDPAGTGFGFDVGLSILFSNHLRLSIALTDFGEITWTKNTAQFSNDEPLFIDDLSDESQLDSLIEDVKGSAVPISEFSTQLATAIRIGASYLVSEYDDANFPGYLMLAVDYSQGLNDLPGNSSKPRFGVGLEWQIFSFLPIIRTGIEYNEVEGTNWTFGLGLVTSLLDIHIATRSLQTSIFPQSSSNLSLSLSSRWKF
ncbi:MAG: DUF5723 family protein [Ignavibacteria bacterium]|jgi:hypothetical protein